MLSQRDNGVELDKLFRGGELCLISPNLFLAVPIISKLSLITRKLVPSAQAMLSDITEMSTGHWLLTPRR